MFDLIVKNVFCCCSSSRLYKCNYKFHAKCKTNARFRTAEQCLRGFVSLDLCPIYYGPLVICFYCSLFFCSFYYLIHCCWAVGQLARQASVSLTKRTSERHVKARKEVLRSNEAYYIEFLGIAFFLELKFDLFFFFLSNSKVSTVTNTSLPSTYGARCSLEKARGSYVF